MSQKRNFFRLTYPPGKGPDFDVAGRKYQIIDMSEGGIRIRLPPTTRLTKGTRVGGDIVFWGGERCSVRGIVLRTQDHNCVIELSEGVPLSKIMDEQLRLIKIAKGE